MRLTRLRHAALFFPLALIQAADNDTASVIRLASVSARFPSEYSTTHKVHVDLGVRNLSSSMITAYSYVVTARYDDASTRTVEGSLDDLSALVKQRIGGSVMLAPNSPQVLGPTASDYENTTQAIQPGETKWQTVTIPLSASGTEATSASGELTMVAFADGTAVGDLREITALRYSRKRQADYVSAFVDALRSIKAYPSQKKRAEELIAEFRLSPSQQERNLANLVRMVSGALSVSPAALDAWLSAYEAHLSVYTEQSTLKEK